MIQPFDSITPLIEKVLAMYRGMHRQPKLIQDHLRRCELTPDECLLCALIFGKVDQHP